MPDARPRRARDKRRQPRTPSAQAPKAPWLALHGAPAISGREAAIERTAATALIALFGLALLAIALGPHRIGDYLAETDFYGDYAKGARLIEHGRLLPARYGVVGPVYEIALGLLGFVVRDLFLAAKLLSIAAAVGTVALWRRILERRGDTRVALAMVLFLAVNPFLFRYGHSASTDALAIGLQAGCLALLLTAEGARAIALSGVLAGVAFLTRYNAVALLPAGLIAALAGWTTSRRRRGDAFRFLAGWALPVLPWTLYALGHGGGLAIQLHHNIAYEVFARARGITWDEYQYSLQPQFHSLWDVIARDPAAVAQRMLFNVWDHLRLDATNLLGLPTAAAALIGLLLAARDRRLGAFAPVWVTGALLFMTLVPVFYSERYALALLPYYLAPAALGAGSPSFALALGAARRVWLKPAFALIPLGLALSSSIALQKRHMNQLPVEVLGAARTLQRLERPGDRVIARKPHIASIAGADALPFPFTHTLGELAAYAQRQNARWLFVSWPEVESRPDYWYLLDTSAVVPGLTPREVTRPHPSVLYEIGPGFGATPGWFANDTLRSYHVARAKLMVDGTNRDALFVAGLIERNRDPELARRYLERLVSLAPADPRARIALGEVLLTMNDTYAAAATFDEAMAIDPGNLEARLGRGWASLMAGRPNEAARLWRPAVERTNDVETLEQMVALYRSLNDPGAAVAAETRLSHLKGGR